MTRTIMDGTTDMRDPKSVCVFLGQACDGPDGHLSGFCRTRRKHVASPPAATARQTLVSAFGQNFVKVSPDALINCRCGIGATGGRNRSRQPLANDWKPTCARQASSSDPNVYLRINAVARQPEPRHVLTGSIGQSQMAFTIWLGGNSGLAAEQVYAPNFGDGPTATVVVEFSEREHRKSLRLT